MKLFFQEFVSFLKKALQDFGLLYKNFVSWLFLKVLLFAYSILIAVVISLPFVLILVIFFYFSSIDWLELLSAVFGGSIGIEHVTMVTEYPVNFAIGLILALFLFTAAFLGFSYNKILLNWMNIAFIDNKKLPYFSLEYFNVTRFWKYISLSAWSGLFLLVPFLIFIVGFLILVAFIGGFQSAFALLQIAGSAFTISVGALLVVSVLIFFYIVYRIYFAFILLVDESKNKKDKKALEFIKESVGLTTGWKKLLYMLGGMIGLLIVLSPVSYVSEKLDETKKEMQDYVVYALSSEENKQVIEQTDMYYYQNLQLKYNGRNTQMLLDRIQMFNIYVIVFNVLFFVGLFGLKEMYYVSFYRRVLLEK